MGNDYDVYRSKGRNGANRDKGYNSSNGSKPKPISPKPLPDNYVEEAESAIIRLGRPSRPKNEGKLSFHFTSTQLRNLFAQVMEVYKKVNIPGNEPLSGDVVNQLQMVQLRIAYNAGRFKEVDKLVKETKMLSYLKGVGRSKEKLIQFTQYMEALVAYHRFYTDKED